MTVDEGEIPTSVTTGTKDAIATAEAKIEDEAGGVDIEDIPDPEPIIPSSDRHCPQHGPRDGIEPDPEKDLIL